jgi:hypothetical protein
MARTQILRVLVTREEHERLHALAISLGRSEGATVRWLVDQVTGAIAPGQDQASGGWRGEKQGNCTSATRGR